MTGTRRAARWLGVRTRSPGARGPPEESRCEESTHEESRREEPRTRSPRVRSPGARRPRARRPRTTVAPGSSHDRRAHAANRNSEECSRQMRQFTEANCRNVRKIRELSQHEAVPDWSAPFRQSFLNRVETEHAQETDDDDGSGGAAGGPCDRADARSDAIAAKCHFVEGAGYY